eukprot:3395357-Ditylum_brightwellii.AAC.1
MHLTQMLCTWGKQLCREEETLDRDVEGLLLLHYLFSYIGDTVQTEFVTLPISSWSSNRAIYEAATVIQLWDEEYAHVDDLPYPILECGGLSFLFGHDVMEMALRRTNC